MAKHPFTSGEERDLENGIAALNRLGYFTTARSVQSVLDEQRRARSYREGK